MATLPNWFILGAARCGTTTLWHALSQHPQIFLSAVKEPSFFCEPYQLVRDPITYADLFASAEDAVAVGEASHAYLTHPGAARTIHTFFPDARFVLILRNPADRAYSLYARLLSAGYERLPTFELALAAEDRRFHSTRFKRTCPQYLWNYLYFRSGRFGEQVARYLELYPLDRFYITTLYQLIADPGRVLSDIHAFLGVRPLPVAELPRLELSAGVRSVAVEVLNRKYLFPIARRSSTGAGAFWGRLQRWNSAPVAPLHPETRAALLDRYRPDLAFLHELTGVDILEEQRHLADAKRSGLGCTADAPQTPTPRNLQILASVSNAGLERIPDVPDAADVPGV